MQTKLKEAKRGPDGLLLEGTGNKIFDNQCDIIAPGNVHTNTQFSGYIRPKSEVECNGKTFEPGELQLFDMKGFRTIGCPSYILRIASQETEKHGTICLYQFRHWVKEIGKERPREIIHGWIIADYQNNFITSIMANRRQKSMMVLVEVQPYICNYQ